MKSWIPKFVAAALVLGGGIGLAQAQQSSGDRPMQGHGQGQLNQQDQGTGGAGMGMRPEMKRRMMSEKKECARMERGTRAHSRRMMPIMFAIMDADGDGALSLQEFQEVHARIFKHIDTDKDGRVKMEDIQDFFRFGDD